MVALGGGVVGDLAGFVAATYQRGVRLVHVPTTLLAMVDSAIGGKTGVDLPEGKNYVGAFWQPELVVMDVAVLGGLPAEELAAGFAEVVKYGLLAGGELNALVEGWPSLPGPEDALIDLIRRCVAYKLEVVDADERDHGRRAVLNLGHTVGHGIEAAGRLRALPPRRGRRPGAAGRPARLGGPRRPRRGLAGAHQGGPRAARAPGAGRPGGGDGGDPGGAGARQEGRRAGAQHGADLRARDSRSPAPTPRASS